MALMTNTFESGTDGVDISPANSASPDAITLATTTAATVQFSTAQFQKGTKSLRYVYNGAVGQAGVQFNQATLQTSTAVRLYLKLMGMPSTSSMCVFCLTSASLTSRRLWFGVNNNAYPVVYDNVGGWRGYGGASSFTGGGQFSTDTWYRIEIGASTGTGSGDGSSDLRIYTGDSTSQITNMSWTATAQSYGSAAGGFQNLLLGRFNADTPAVNGTPTWYYDDVAWNLGSATLLGPSTVPVTSGDVFLRIG
jgi:hypothetical protein